MSSSQFYLQDSRSFVGNNVQWWAKDGNGYTTDLSRAHIFTRKDAIGQHECRASDIPWTKAYIDGKPRQVVDMQYLKKAEAADMDGPFYLQDNSDFDGNDVFWLSINGAKRSTDITQAATFNREEVARLCQSCGNYIAWPKAYVDGKTRPAVKRQHIDREEALAGTGIVLRKPERPKPNRLQCGACKRFLSVAQLWSGECPNCGADSRP